VLSVAVDEELLLELTTLVARLELDLELMTELDLELLIELDDLLELITLELDTLDLLLETVDELSLYRTNCHSLSVRLRYR
jgi:hypothetical protein